MKEKTPDEALEPTKEIRLKYYEELCKLLTDAHAEMAAITNDVDRDVAIGWFNGHVVRLGGCMMGSCLTSPTATVDIQYMIEASTNGYKQGIELRGASKQTVH